MTFPWLAQVRKQKETQEKLLLAKQGASYTQVWECRCLLILVGRRRGVEQLLHVFPM